MAEWIGIKREERGEKRKEEEAKKHLGTRARPDSTRIFCEPRFRFVAPPTLSPVADKRPAAGRIWIVTSWNQQRCNNSEIEQLYQKKKDF